MAPDEETGNAGDRKEKECEAAADPATNSELPAPGPATRGPRGTIKGDGFGGFAEPGLHRPSEASCTIHVTNSPNTRP